MEISRKFRTLQRHATIFTLAIFSGSVLAGPVTTLTVSSTASVVNGQPHYSGANQRVLEEGWLAAQLQQRGVKLVWVPVTGDVGATINEAFSSHRTDFASYGDLPSIILNASGTRTQVVVPYGRGTDTFLLVPPNSTATSLRDLKGKRIALHRGRPWHLAFLRLAEQSGFKSTDFTLVNMDLQPGAAALASGNIDAMFAISAYPLADKGIAKIIWSSKGQIDKKIRAEVWGSKEFIDQHPDLTQLVATAFVRAQHWASQEKNREAVIHESTLGGTPEKSARQAFDDKSLAWKDYFTPVFDQAVLDHYRRTVGYTIEKNLVRTPVRAEDLLRPEFVNAALKELKLEHFWTQVPLKP